MDYGGPKREFFRLFAIEASDVYFQGKPNYKFFINKVTALQVCLLVFFFFFLFYCY